MSSASDGGLSCETAGGVARVTIQRPERGNSLTRPMVAELADFLAATSGDRAVRAVVIAASGDKFCTGPDLNVSLNNDGPQPDPPTVVGDLARGMRRYWQRLVTAVLDCEKPVMAAVGGVAAGAGAQLVLACDLVIAGQSARLTEIFVRRGIAPDAGAAYLLTRLVGVQQAKRICFFGKPVHAEEAMRLGLVTEVVADEQLADRVDELAAELAAAPTAAVAAAKQLINHAPDVDRCTSLSEEAWLQEAIVSGSHDAREGLNSFIEHRAPKFVGY